MPQLSHETILITGATSGFGAACARQCSAEGAALILLGRRKERLEALQRELGGDIRILPLDIRDKDATVNAIAQLPPITALINNAGLALGMEPAQSCHLEDWEVMVDTNIKGLLTVTHAVLPGMVARNRGYIINIGSTAGIYPYQGGNVYGASKAFVHQLSLNLRADLLGTAVRVTVIEPGMAETEFSEVRFKGDTDKAREVYGGVEAITADDIATTILWCLTRPPHININCIELMPVAQTPGKLAVHRA